MKRILRKLFPNLITRADLTIVEGDLGAEIKAIRARLDMVAAAQGVMHEANEINTMTLKGRVTALEGGLATTIRRLNGIDAVQGEIEKHVFIDAAELTRAIEESSRDAVAATKAAAKFEALPLSPEGNATRTEIVEIKQPKGRGPKGGAK